jgi:hypothetical protein
MTATTSTCVKTNRETGTGLLDLIKPAGSGRGISVPDEVDRVGSKATE